MSLKGKIAIVTGGSRGIGRAISVRLAKEGARVVVNYSDHADKEFKGAAQETVSLIEKTGGEATAFSADVSKKEEVEKLIAFTVKEFGHVDILVANAGICPFEEFLKIDEELLDRVLGVNFKGAFFAAQGAAQNMVEKKIPGRLIFISSVSSIFGGELQSHYCPTKGAINQLMKSIAIALGKYGITANAVLPGTVLTDINRKELTEDKELLDYFVKRTPTGRLAEPKDIASAVAFFARDDASSITGTTLIVDGGMSVNLQ
ncbi:short-chain dehydrogenase [bacterium]|nr:short-chain dehydrogenase [bacterium]|tara:strand:- start:25985 stop:26764 length:780 start_codon:yes stop_codon:yes gene_type:complete